MRLKAEKIDYRGGENKFDDLVLSFSVSSWRVKTSLWVDVWLNHWWRWMDKGPQHQDCCGMMSHDAERKLARFWLPLSCFWCVKLKATSFFSFVCGVLLCVNHFLSLRKVKETHDQNQFSYYKRLLSVTKRMQEHFMNNLNEHWQTVLIEDMEVDKNVTVQFSVWLNVEGTTCKLAKYEGWLGGYAFPLFCL